jgi:hypothetical protein
MFFFGEVGNESIHFFVLLVCAGFWTIEEEVWRCVYVTFFCYFGRRQTWDRGSKELCFGGTFGGSMMCYIASGNY